MSTSTTRLRIGRRRPAAVLAACFAAATGAILATPSFALAPSTFESTDGNTTVQTTQDWNGLSPTTKLEADTADTTSGPTDESFTQGTKSDTAVPTVETGSIPPNKSDLTRMRVASETVSGDVFLYVAWDRSNTLGSANMNFEFNQTQTLSANGETPVRTAGDVLITYDFANGGNSPSLGLAKWSDTGPCYANGSKAPCWANFVDLTASNYADGSISGDGKFGEAAINLTDAGIFTTGTCTSLGSAYLTSRSSASFSAALKDFVPPANISITNCGSIEIHKTDDASPANPLAGAVFTLYHNSAPLTSPRGAEDLVTSPAQTCTTGATGVCTISNVFFGTYWVVETTVPSGYAAAADVAVNVPNTTKVVVNLVDPRLRGAIEITKTAKHFDSPTTTPNLQATFVVKQGTTTVATVQTSASTGKVCVPNLLFGSYTVQETAGQTGYQLDPDTENATVNAAATGCATGQTFATVSFENKPLSDVTVSFSPQVTGGTAASIVCTAQGSSTVLGGDSTPLGTVFDDTSETLTGLVEGTYVCTIVVDP